MDKKTNSNKSIVCDSCDNLKLNAELINWIEHLKVNSLSKKEAKEYMREVTDFLVKQVYNRK